jgi:type IV fimbrial biogenesis protein FimT
VTRGQGWPPDNLETRNQEDDMDVTSPLRRPLAGVSLVELLSTTAIALTLTAFAVPSMRAFVSTQYTLAASQAIRSHLALARHTAVTSATDVVLCPSSDGLHCTGGFDWSDGWVVFLDADGDRQRGAAERRLAVAERLSGGARLITSSGRRKVVYRSHGGTGGSNVTFRICKAAQPERRRAVIVNITGRSKVSDRDSNGRPIECG